MALFNADIIKEVSIDWLTVTLKYDNDGGGKQCAFSPKDHGTRCAIGLLRPLSINWTNKTR